MAGLALAACLIAGCGDPPEPQQSPSARDKRAQELRIVSLSPALTRMAVDLGLEDAIVGRSSFCTAVNESVPAVGDLMNADTERIIRLDPTHVLIQEPASGGDGLMRQMADREGWTLGAWRSIDRVADVERVLRRMSDLLVAHPAADEAAIRERRDALLAEIDAAASRTDAEAGSIDAASIGPVLLVYSTTEPIGVFGRDTYLDDLLAAAGGMNATTAASWANLTLEDVVRIDPAAIVLVQPDSSADADPMTLLGRLKDLPIEAVKQEHVALLRHRDALLPSTTLPAVAADLRRALAELAPAEGSRR
jgi:ABC-type hemin transport system substrate-binding protein